MRRVPFKTLNSTTGLMQLNRVFIILTIIDGSTILFNHVVPNTFVDVHGLIKH